MKRFFTIIFILLYTLPVHSISSYSASYDLFTQTDLGYIKFGSAKYKLQLGNNVYVFSSNATTDLLWRAIHDYSVNETSIGLLENSQLIGNYYKITETKGNSISDNYEIHIYPNERYVSLNNEIIWEINSSNIVDALSVYLNISEDIQKDPNKKVFSYQIVDKKGVHQREFVIEGFETIIIDNKEFETIRIACPKLSLIFNVSKNHNFMPVSINKTNGKNNYRFTLKDYNQ
ncbi:DUF3108 domain-containing protein [Candidatus Thioglobus sp.]|nr:DUF3108 domain-containing protein [Candidatus Thioglobus sp.]